jgi:hypothetical protein
LHIASKNLETTLLTPKSVKRELRDFREREREGERERERVDT